jgi:DNA-binding transcriptional regulator YiaG
MQAFDIAGKRGGSKVRQDAMARRLGWHPATLRDVELGNVEITDMEHSRLHDVLDVMIAEVRAVKEDQKEGVLA